MCNRQNVERIQCGVACSPVREAHRRKRGAFPLRAHERSVTRQLLLDGKRKSNAPLERFLTYIDLSAWNRLSLKTLAVTVCASAVCIVH